jgi:hypothetical protein
MWILPEKKICFLANAKTASLATAFALNSLGFKHFGDQHCIPAASGWPQWREIDNTWTIFSTVRNHYDVLVSWYFHNTRAPEASKYFGRPFERFLYEWVDSEWFRDGQMYWKRASLCDRILRYETLQTDFSALLYSCNLPATKIELHNVSKNRKGRHWQEFYTDKSLQFVAGIFGEEMKLYGY